MPEEMTMPKRDKFCFGRTLFSLAVGSPVGWVSVPAIADRLGIGCESLEKAVVLMGMRGPDFRLDEKDCMFARPPVIRRALGALVVEDDGDKTELRRNLMRYLAVLESRFAGKGPAVCDVTIETEVKDDGKKRRYPFCSALVSVAPKRARAEDWLEVLESVLNGKGILAGETAEGRRVMLAWHRDGTLWMTLLSRGEDGSITMKDRIEVRGKAHFVELVGELRDAKLYLECSSELREYLFFRRATLS